MAPSIHISLIEDNERFRRGVQQLIDDSPGFRCVGAWPTVEAALCASELGRTQVLLLDLELPGVDGDEGVSLLLGRFPSLLIVIFTAHDDDHRVLSCLCRGACGYLLKSTTPPQLLEALQQTIDGGSPMSPTIARKVVRLFRDAMPYSPHEQPLTNREKELLGLLAAGHSYQTSGIKLGISVNTVRTHIRSVYEKLQVHSQSEAVSKALRAGFI